MMAVLVAFILGALCGALVHRFIPRKQALPETTRPEEQNYD